MAVASWQPGLLSSAAGHRTGAGLGPPGTRSQGTSRRQQKLTARARRERPTCRQRMCVCVRPCVPASQPRGSKPTRGRGNCKKGSQSARKLGPVIEEYVKSDRPCDARGQLRQGVADQVRRLAGPAIFHDPRIPQRPAGRACVLAHRQ